MKRKKKSFISLFLFACASLSLVPSSVEVRASGSVEITPLAKYEFNDSTNPGKDSMGNYHLSLSGNGTVSVEDSIATFNGTAGLISNPDLTEDLDSFTLVFDVKTELDSPEGWAEVIGFGWDNWTPTKWNTFHKQAGTSVLRFGSHGNMSVTQNQSWGDEVGDIGTSEFHKVGLSLNKSGNTVVYLDGQAVHTYTTPSDYTLSDPNMYFAIGGNATWGAVARWQWKGQMDTVAIYDFAFEADQMSEYCTTGKITAAADVAVVTSANVDLSETVVVPENADDVEILLHAPSSSVIDVTMSNEETQQATVKWEAVKEIDGEKYLEGSIQGLLNPENVKAYAKIGYATNVKEILPLAKYEFKDSTNPGKDSMGKYNLVVKSEGETQGIIAVSEGVATFNGTAALISPDEANDISEVLDSFTLSFDITTSAAINSWEEPIGFGWNDWGASKWNLFELAGGSNTLRYSAAGSLVEGKGDVDGNINQWWAPEIGNVGSNMHSVVLSVNLEGNIEVYFDGVKKYSYATPENYSLKNENMKFAIGGNGTWGAARNFFNGSIANVAIYDFAANEQQAKVLGATKQVKTTTASNLVYMDEVSSAPIFENGAVSSETLVDTMTAYEMLKVINNATVEGTMTDSSKVTLPVEWKDVEITSDSYVLVGEAQVTGDYLTTVKKVQIRYELTVQKTQPIEPPTSELPSDEPSEEPSGEVSQEPSLSEPDVSEPGTSTQQPAKKGCKGSATASMIGLLTVAAALILKKKKN